MIESLYDPFKKWSEGGSVWIISDPHFGDADCPYMNPGWVSPEEQVRRINRFVQRNETLIILGDVGNKEWIRRLNGYKVLLTGNHDSGKSVYQRDSLFNEVYNGPLTISDRIILSHEPVMLPFMSNIHGHCHGGKMRYINEFGCGCINVAADVCDYSPINLGREIKNGLLSTTPTIHRVTIDLAAMNRGAKLLRKG